MVPPKTTTLSVPCLEQRGHDPPPHRIHYSTLIRRSKRIFQIGYAPNRRGGRILRVPSNDRSKDNAASFVASFFHRPPCGWINPPSSLRSFVWPARPYSSENDRRSKDRYRWKKKRMRRNSNEQITDKNGENEERGRRHRWRDGDSSMVKLLGEGNEIGQTRRFRRREETGAARRRDDG